MLETLLKLYRAAHRQYRSLELVLRHNCIMDWEIIITRSSTGEVIFHSNDVFLDRVTPDAYRALSDWLFQQDDNVYYQILDNIGAF